MRKSYYWGHLDGLWRHYARRERQILYDLTCRRKLKPQKTHRKGDQRCGSQRQGRGKKSWRTVATRDTLPVIRQSVAGWVRTAWWLCQTLQWDTQGRGEENKPGGKQFATPKYVFWGYYFKLVIFQERKDSGKTSGLPPNCPKEFRQKTCLKERSDHLR